MMDPSKPNSKAERSTNDSDTSRLTTPCLSSGDKNGPSTNLSHQSPSPSATLQPSSNYEPSAPDMEPPSYSSVIAQDLNDWKNLTHSSSGHSNVGPYPPVLPHLNTKSTGLDNQMPYPMGPGPITNATNLTEGIRWCPVPAMPAPVRTGEPIGFENVVTNEPKSTNLGLLAKEHGTTMSGTDHNSKNDRQKLIQPPMSGENTRFIQTIVIPQEQPSPSNEITCLEYFLCCCECLRCCVAVTECIVTLNNN